MMCPEMDELSSRYIHYYFVCFSDRKLEQKLYVCAVHYCYDQDLKDERRRDDIAAARATLKKNSIMLLTTSKVSNFPHVVMKRLPV